MGGRFLVLSAGMGAGHDTVAGELARRLTARGHLARQADVLQLLPLGLGSGVRAFYRTTVRHLPAVYQGLYAAFFRPGGGPRPGSAPLAALAEEPLLALVEEYRPQVVVPVFHLAAQLTGRLRRSGRLRVPTAVAVTDFVVHRQWLHSGNDLHLCVSEDAARQVAQALRRPAAAPGPVVPPAYRRPGGVPASLPPELDEPGAAGPVVLLSTGAWGVSSAPAATARLLHGAGYQPVVLCGRDEPLRRRLAAQPGVTALGWTDRLPRLMGAAAALIDNAAGQTAVQALAAGLPVIGYRPLPGHGAEGVRRMAALGLTSYVRTPQELVEALGEVTAPGPGREARIAAGRALFASDTADHLVALARTGGPQAAGVWPAPRRTRPRRRRPAVKR